jgi:hypothetical protein
MGQRPKQERTASQSLKAVLGVRDLVFSGEIPPGARLSEINISERLGISRTPVRAALARLEQEGLLNARPTGGFVAAQLLLERFARYAGHDLHARGALVALAGPPLAGYVLVTRVKWRLVEPLIVCWQAAVVLSAALIAITQTSAGLVGVGVLVPPTATGGALFRVLDPQGGGRMFRVALSVSLMTSNQASYLPNAPHAGICAPSV